MGGVGPVGGAGAAVLSWPPPAVAATCCGCCGCHLPWPPPAVAERPNPRRGLGGGGGAGGGGRRACGVVSQSGPFQTVVGSRERGRDLPAPRPPPIGRDSLAGVDDERI